MYIEMIRTRKSSSGNTWDLRPGSAFEKGIRSDTLQRLQTVKANFQVGSPMGEEHFPEVDK